MFGQSISQRWQNRTSDTNSEKHPGCFEKNLVRPCLKLNLIDFTPPRVLTEAKNQQLTSHKKKHPGCLVNLFRSVGKTELVIQIVKNIRVVSKKT